MTILPKGTGTITAASAASGSRVLGVGGYRPERVVMNSELVEAIDSSDEWIQERSGIISRRFAAPDESVVDMAEKAARDAIGNAGLALADIDTIDTELALADLESVDKALDAATVEFSADRRSAIFRPAAKLVTDDVGHIPLFHYQNIWAAKKGLKVTPLLSDRTTALQVTRAAK